MHTVKLWLKSSMRHAATYLDGESGMGVNQHAVSEAEDDLVVPDRIPACPVQDPCRPFHGRVNPHHRVHTIAPQFSSSLQILSPHHRDMNLRPRHSQNPPEASKNPKHTPPAKLQFLDSKLLKCQNPQRQLPPPP